MSIRFLPSQVFPEGITLSPRRPIARFTATPQVPGHRMNALPLVLGIPCRLQDFLEFSCEDHEKCKATA
jgi:hypothetical protein